MSTQTEMMTAFNGAIETLLTLCAKNDPPFFADARAARRAIQGVCGATPGKKLYYTIVSQNDNVSFLASFDSKSRYESCVSNNWAPVMDTLRMINPEIDAGAQLRSAPIGMFPASLEFVLLASESRAEAAANMRSIYVSVPIKRKRRSADDADKKQAADDDGGDAKKHKKKKHKKSKSVAKED